MSIVKLESFKQYRDFFTSQMEPGQIYDTFRIRSKGSVIVSIKYYRINQIKPEFISDVVWVKNPGLDLGDPRDRGRGERRPGEAGAHDHEVEQLSNPLTCRELKDPIKSHSALRYELV